MKNSLYIYALIFLLTLSTSAFTDQPIPIIGVEKKKAYSEVEKKKIEDNFLEITKLISNIDNIAKKNEELLSKLEYIFKNSDEFISCIVRADLRRNLARIEGEYNEEKDSKNKLKLKKSMDIYSRALSEAHKISPNLDCNS